MKVGSLLYATDQGLGILGQALVADGTVTHPCVVQHSRHVNHRERYPGAPAVFSASACLRELGGCDWALFLETPFHWDMLPELKRRGARVALLTMYECTPERYAQHPDVDLFLCPSDLDFEKFARTGRAVRVEVPLLPVPFRARGRCKLFVHNRGWGSFQDRNGTETVLAAWKLLKSPAELLLRSQEPFPGARVGTVPREELYSVGDAFVFPERFNGLSLPLLEARAAGMLVLASDRPTNRWLPEDQLARVRRAAPMRPVGPGYMEVSAAHVDPVDLAALVDSWYGKDLAPVSAEGAAWAAARKSTVKEVLCAFST